MKNLITRSILQSGIIILQENPEQHFHELMQIYQKAYNNLLEYAYKEPKEILSYLMWLKQRGKGNLIIVKVNDQIIGFSGIDDCWFAPGGQPVGEIHEFVIDPEYQRRGIGHQLFEFACCILKRKGCNKLGLWVGEKNKKARTFYERHGFKYAGHWGKWIRMEKTS